MTSPNGNGFAPTGMSDHLLDATHRMLEPGRIRPTRWPGVLRVEGGDGQRFHVRSRTDRIVCDCVAFVQFGRCAHSLAAMVYWYEEGDADGELHEEEERQAAGLGALAWAIGLEAAS
jgi:hypothetical protein